MNIIQHSFLDYPSNDTSCVSVYLSGCDNNCEGCHNDHLKYHVGIDYDLLCKYILKATDRFKTKDICLLGGDPLYEKNIETTNKLLSEFGSNYNFCIYTGYGLDHAKQILIPKFRFLKTGRFNYTLQQESKKNNDIFVLSSKNQCLYDSNFNLLSNNGIYFFNKED